MKLVISGRLNSSGKVPFNRGFLLAHALIAGEEASRAPIDENGEFSIEIESGAAIPAVEVCVLPVGIERAQAGTMMLSKTISSSKFVPDKATPGVLRASETFFLPADLLRRLQKRGLRYHVHGAVYVQHDTYFERLGGARIDFHEIDSIDDSGLGPLGAPSLPIRLRDELLGSAYTTLDGTYDFTFRFPALVLSKQPPVLVSGILDRDKRISLDAAPDIRARIHLFIDGVWTMIHEVPMSDFDWNISTDFHRDYVVPASAATGTPVTGVKPEEGFRYISVGLIPIDDTRFVDGYVTSQPGDPIPGIRHQPLCGTLRIFGLFASTPAVATYTVEYLQTDASGVAVGTATWQRITDPLSNLKWDSTTHQWKSEPLDDEAPGTYRNIDTEPEANWLLHGLKIAWNTLNVHRGYYKLRITGKAGETVITQRETPVFCIDNTLPQARIDVLSPAATECGLLNLGADRVLTFRITAYQENGHLLGYWISGNRGRVAENAGVVDPSRGLDGVVRVSRPDPDADWSGVVGGSQTFTVAPRSTATATCSTMAYSFHLRVQGSATNGYASSLTSFVIPADTNLVVSE